MFVQEKLGSDRGKAYAVFFCHNGWKEGTEGAEMAEGRHGGDTADTETQRPS
jgi:hypothetical protein